MWPERKCSTKKIWPRFTTSFSHAGQPLQHFSSRRRSHLVLRSKTFRPDPSPKPSADGTDVIAFAQWRKVATTDNRAAFQSRGPLPLSASVRPDGLSLTLPVPPSINHQYATVNGRRLLSATGRLYKSLVSEHVMIALSQASCRNTLLRSLQNSELILSIRFFFTSRLRRDVDGGLKIAQDALCQGLGINDNRIIETHLYKHVDKTVPRIELRLSLALID